MNSKENATIIRALNNYGRVPEQHELLDEIETLKQELQRKDNNWNELKEWIRNFTVDSDDWNKLIYDEWGNYGIENRMILDKIKELEKM